MRQPSRVDPGCFNRAVAEWLGHVIGRGALLQEVNGVGVSQVAAAEMLEVRPGWRWSEARGNAPGRCYSVGVTSCERPNRSHFPGSSAAALGPVWARG